MSDIVVPKQVRPAAELAVAIADLMDEARAGGHEALRYFLDIARVEAELAAGREASGPRQIRKR